MIDSMAEIKSSDNIWDGDLLGRKEEAMYLQRYIENLYKLDKKDQTSFVLNINSEWGHGKTWFLTRLKKELAKNHPVVYFDAWKNDFSKDALLSFVSIVCEELIAQFADQPKINSKVQAVKRAFSKWGKKAVPIVAAATVKQLTGITLDKLNDSSDADLSNNDFASIAEELTKVASSCAMEEFSKKKDAIKLFEQSINALVAEIHDSGHLYLPICIFVDELDRCRPTYAIELLEAIKHLFAIKGIFFVLATDTQQLSHSIKSVYGQSFNATAYLKRFFYSEYSLENPNYDKVANYFFNSSNLHEKLYLPESLRDGCGFGLMFAKVAEYFRLHMRQQEQIFYSLESIVVSSEKDQFHMLLLLLFLCFKQKYPDEYQRFPNLLDQFKLPEFLSSKSMDGVFSEVTFYGMYNSNKGSQSKSYTLTSVFEYYAQLLDGDLNSSHIMRRGLGYDWQLEISQNLIGGASPDFRSGKYDRGHDLSSYFSLVNRAGKIISGLN